MTYRISHFSRLLRKRYARLKNQRIGKAEVRFVTRLGVPIIVALLLSIIALRPAADRLIGLWFQHDLQLRSQLIFNSASPSLSQLARSGDKAEIGRLFASITEDERVLSIGLCNSSNMLEVATKDWPHTFTCPQPDLHPRSYSSHIEHNNLLIATFPLADHAKALGQLVVLQDQRFLESRRATVNLYLTGFICFVGLIAAAVAMLMARVTMRSWIRSVLEHLANRSDTPREHDPALSPVIGEIRQLIRDLDLSNQMANAIRIQWSPEVLRRVLETELEGSQVIVVSNREPYIHHRSEDGKIHMHRPASGMVTALEPIMRTCGGTWIAHGSGSADREHTDSQDRVAVPPADPAYTLRRLWLSEEEERGYYYGLSNEGLWPLCHITFVRPVFRESDWLLYESVNRRFAEAVIEEATQEAPLILVQDYHLALVPRMIKERLPKATIITFWHIPWPNPEVFSICPWREAVLDGLLGSSIIGFHTQFHCNNFMETTDRFLESHIDREQSIISAAGYSALIRPYPISIAWPPDGMENQLQIPECRQRIFRQYGLPSDAILAVGVERFDFTKGIPDRFRAVEMLLETYPDLVGRFVLLQVAAPTRGNLPAYEEIRRKSIATVTAINERFKTGKYKPIHLVIRHHEPDAVFELFRAADICIVSSLHDGMNLVAKEFVAARDDDDGVLVLSSFAGASRELMDALIVNPFDAKSTAEAIHRAIAMPQDERKRRMQLMRELVKENNIFYWAGRMLLDAARLRKRAKISAAIANVDGDRLSA